MTVIELVWSSIVIPALAQYEDVIATTERIRIDSYGTEVDI